MYVVVSAITSTALFDMRLITLSTLTPREMCPPVHLSTPHYLRSSDPILGVDTLLVPPPTFVHPLRGADHPAAGR